MDTPQPTWAQVRDLYAEINAYKAALRNLVAAAEKFSKANRAWFESRILSPRLGIPIPGKRETEEVTKAWQEMDTAVTAAKEVIGT